MSPHETIWIVFQSYFPGKKYPQFVVCYISEERAKVKDLIINDQNMTHVTLDTL